MLRSGKLARLTRVSADLLRHYERIEILPPPSRSSNGYRLYAPQMVERVRAVRHAVSRIFAVSDRGGFPVGVSRPLPEKNYTASSGPSQS